MVHLGLFLVSMRFLEATTIDRTLPLRSSSRSLAGGAGTVLVMVGCFMGTSWKWWADLTARCSGNLWESLGLMGLGETMGNQTTRGKPGSKELPFTALFSNLFMFALCFHMGL